jgi:hypothetical protein
MPATAEGRRERLVLDLVGELERGGLRYAVLRNYERYPHFDHDLDLVMHGEDVDAFRAAAVAAAAATGWDALTECDHWAQSSFRNHNIQVFRFYRFDPPEGFQVDLFHGFNLWRMPLGDEGGLLAGRAYDQAGGFTRIDERVENLQRMLQIHRVAKAGNRGRRVERYRRRVADFCRRGGRGAMERLLRRTFGPAGSEALAALCAGDVEAFSARMAKARRAFFAGHLARHPIGSARALAAGLVDHARLNRTRQCGFVLETHAAQPERLRVLADVLAELKAANVLYAWTDAGSERPNISRDERRVMERGGIVVKRSNKARARIDLDAAGSADVRASVMDTLVARHRVLFSREGGEA